MLVLENNRQDFGVDFEENKKSLNMISTIRSKSLKNQIAGYITRFIKKQIRFESEKQELIENQEQPTEEAAPTEEKSKDEPVVEEAPAEEVQD